MPNISRPLRPTGLLALAVASLFAAVASGMSICVLKSSKSCTGKIRGYEQVNYSQISKYPQMTGTDSRGDSPPRHSIPTFYDLNGDGNDDLIAGARHTNKFEYFSTSLDGTFVQQTGSNNPFDFIVPPEHDSAESTSLHAAFFDADGDGDGDLAYVVYYAPTRFFENIGTATVPIFEERFNTRNPLIGIAGLPDLFGTRSLAFVDLDGDGDEDYIIGLGGGAFYCENTGNHTSALFTYRTGTADPFYSIDVGSYAVPQFHDIDGDGDYDLLVCSTYELLFYENTGSATNPAFTLRTGEGNNPFHRFAEDHRIASVRPSFMRTHNNGVLLVIGSGRHLDAEKLVFNGKLLYLKPEEDPFPQRYKKRTDGGSNPFLTAKRELSANRHLSPVFGDFNGNNLKDVLIGSRYGLDIFSNTGTPTHPVFVLTTFPGTLPSDVEYLKPTVADINDDGKIDVLIVSFLVDKTSTFEVFRHSCLTLLFFIGHPVRSLFVL